MTDSSPSASGERSKRRPKGHWLAGDSELVLARLERADNSDPNRTADQLWHFPPYSVLVSAIAHDKKDVTDSLSPDRVVMGHGSVGVVLGLKARRTKVIDPPAPIQLECNRGHVEFAKHKLDFAELNNRQPRLNDEVKFQVNNQAITHIHPPQAQQVLQFRVSPKNHANNPAQTTSIKTEVTLTHPTEEPDVNTDKPAGQQQTATVTGARDVQIIQTIAERIRNANIGVQGLSSGDEKKKLLEKLCSDVEAMVKELQPIKPQEAANAASDLQTIVDEARSTSPREKRFLVSAEGLLDAAKFVGKFTSSIGATVKSLAGLLGFPLP